MAFEIDFIRAENGKEALVALDGQDMALAILDVNMPGMTGFELAEIIHHDPATEHLPIIFLSAEFTDDFSILKGYTRGAVDYITKPCKQEILYSKVKVFLDLYLQKKNLQTEIERRITTEAELNQIKDSLEDLIVKRTFDLSRSNETLRQEIVERKKTQELLIIARKKAEQANQAKSEFLANISHEFRTPLHHILSFSRFGVKKAKQIPENDIEDFFNSILDSGKRLLELVEDLLDLSLLESGKTDYHKEKGKLEEILKESIDKWKPITDEKEINIFMECADGSTELVCDIQKIRQIIENLFSNAINYSPEGKNITVSIEPVEHASQLGNGNNLTFPALLTKIKDQGVGIPIDEITTIFDKFTQSSNTKTGAGGKGLGLSICQEIIQAHHGKIWVENNPTGGATFSFILPCGAE